MKDRPEGCLLLLTPLLLPVLLYQFIIAVLATAVRALIVIPRGLGRWAITGKRPDFSDLWNDLF
jgi:hypothetical protein